MKFFIFFCFFLPKTLKIIEIKAGFNFKIKKINCSININHKKEISLISYFKKKYFIVLKINNIGMGFEKKINKYFKLYIIIFPKNINLGIKIIYKKTYLDIESNLSEIYNNFNKKQAISQENIKFPFQEDHHEKLNHSPEQFKVLLKTPLLSKIGIFNPEVYIKEFLDSSLIFPIEITNNFLNKIYGDGFSFKVPGHFLVLIQDSRIFIYNEKEKNALLLILNINQEELKETNENQFKEYKLQFHQNNNNTPKEKKLKQLNLSAENSNHLTLNIIDHLVKLREKRFTFEELENSLINFQEDSEIIRRQFLFSIFEHEKTTKVISDFDQVIINLLKANEYIIYVNSEEMDINLPKVRSLNQEQKLYLKKFDDDTSNLIVLKDKNNDETLIILNHSLRTVKFINKKDENLEQQLKDIGWIII